MLNPKSFCPLPFRQVVIRTDGSVGPCCNNTSLSNIKKENLQQYWNGELLKNFKEQITAGNDTVSGCDLCYKHENQFGRSMRIDALKDHKFFSKKHYEKIFNFYAYNKKIFPDLVEMHLGNFCNLKCLTCRPRDSSKFLIENKILKLSNELQEDFTFDENIINENLEYAFKYCKEIDLRGGESLLVPQIKKYLLELDEYICNDKILRIQTNGTILDDKWKNIFSKFAKLEFMISLDGIEDDLEYIRFPAKWNVILKNLQYFNSLQEKLYINATVSNLNILLLDKLLRWAETNSYFVKLAFVEYPDHFTVENLPQELLDIANKKLDCWKSSYSELNNLFENVKSNTQHWEKFCYEINLRDKHRKNSIFDILPEYKKYWK